MLFGHKLETATGKPGQYLLVVHAVQVGCVASTTAKPFPVLSPFKNVLGTAPMDAGQEVNWVAAFPIPFMSYDPPPSASTSI